MAKKPVKAVKNSAGGWDLLTEKDAGNAILISTGKPERSLAFWNDLKEQADKAIFVLSAAIGEAEIRRRTAIGGSRS
jgi:hypothetical protein